jgi:hypothetical protein
LLERNSRNKKSYTDVERDAMIIYGEFLGEVLNMYLKMKSKGVL